MTLYDEFGNVSEDPTIKRFDEFGNPVEAEAKKSVLPDPGTYSRNDAAALRASLLVDPSIDVVRSISDLSEAGKRFMRLKAKENGKKPGEATIADIQVWMDQLTGAANRPLGEDIPTSSEDLEKKSGIPEAYSKVFPQAARSMAATGDVNAGDVTKGVMTFPLRAGGAALSNLGGLFGLGEGGQEMEMYKPTADMGLGQTIWTGIAGDPYIPLSAMASGGLGMLPRVRTAAEALRASGKAGKAAEAAARGFVEGSVSGIGHGMERKLETGEFGLGGSGLEAGLSAVAGGVFSPLAGVAGGLAKKAQPGLTKARQTGGEFLGRAFGGEKFAKAASKLPEVAPPDKVDDVARFAAEISGKKVDELPIAALSDNPTTATQWEKHIAQGPDGQPTLNRFDDVRAAVDAEHDTILRQLSGSDEFPADEVLAREINESLESAKGRMFDDAQSSYNTAYLENKEAVDQLFSDAGYAFVDKEGVARIFEVSPESPNFQVVQEIDGIIGKVRKDIETTPIAAQRASLQKLADDLENAKAMIGRIDASGRAGTQLQKAAFGANFQELNRMRSLLREYLEDPAILRSETTSRYVKEMEKVHGKLREALVNGIKTANPEEGKRLVEQNRIFRDFFEAEGGLNPMLNKNRTDPANVMKGIFRDSRKLEALLHVARNLPKKQRAMLMNRVKANFLAKAVRTNSDGQILGGSTINKLESPQMKAVFEKLFNPAEREHLLKLFKVSKRVGMPMMPGSGGQAEFSLQEARKKLWTGMTAPMSRARSESQRLDYIDPNRVGYGLDRAAVRGAARGIMLKDLADLESAEE